MHSGAGSVYEIMLKMRAVALSWFPGDQEIADEIVARALKRAIEEVPDIDRVDIEEWLMELLVQACGTLPEPATRPPATSAGHRAQEKTPGNG